MATTISVNKQTIEQFLLNARTKPFLIPEYQRPYSWTSDGNLLVMKVEQTKKEHIF